MNYYSTGWRAYALYRAKPRHVGNMLREMQHKYTKYFDGNPDSMQAIIDWLNANFEANQLDDMHRYIMRGYESGEFKRRGRAFGSRNKANVASENAIADLQKRLREANQQQSPAPIATPAYTPTPIDPDLLANFATKNDLAIHEQANEASFDAVSERLDSIVTRLDNVTENKPLVIHIQPVDAPAPIDIGLQHASFPDLIIALRARQFNGLPLSAWLYGPAGTGKSKACEAAIRVFGREFYGNGKTIDKIEVMGYCDGYGKYHRTQFREAYEHGHGYCADELDSWSPEATVALQGALAGDWAAFPDGMVKRHPNFIFIGAANTTGKGATIEYVGRMQQDAAFLDRFVFVDWPHDNALENALCSNEDWLRYVRKVRDNVNRNNDIRNHLITMRASIHGAALLAAGMQWDKVVNMCLRKGLPPNTWDKIK